jgi:hypothetical protein
LLRIGEGIVTVHKLAISQSRRATLEVVAGVEFIDENGGGAGVRLRKPHQAAKRK